MSAATNPEDARDELAPNDVVGNMLCDELLEMPDDAVIRVLNYYGDWCESAPAWTDFRRTLDRCRGVVAHWPAGEDHDTAIYVRATMDVGLYERATVVDADLDPITVSGDYVQQMIESRGAPELVPLEAVADQFERGGRE
ncbi:hypothetical protein [Haloarcula pellucida]|uniref:Uncharacterized protein n=1 Tax=Haloarcula pellucida TaxID=1427151 RepID=A0A830GT19_9EURY|nr:hypothetical protein [Halomicroarcula pellucida]MBX0350517.1 hypothetical protein [Halomicroarcula pellucida]GGO03699.1 hypothetical protein GCM10009030_39630 [Halomicroarcula pellucida]